ncbi:hypothetical protein OG741_02195 [Streptomyces sp. NBC_01410]|uniref:hypothetical protein n=1 Tax=Streptomyces sp. NBC_01410 TaxID=2903856 RepID=UPI0032558A3F
MRGASGHPARRASVRGRLALPCADKQLIAELTNLDKTLTNYGLGQFKRMAEEFAGQHV